MIVSQIDIYRLNVELTRPTVVPIGVLDAARNVIIRITTDCGLQGWGEASPFAPITGDTQDSNFVTARLLGKLLLNKDPLALEERLREINAATVGESSLRSAFDMALYDIVAQTAGLPLYRFLGGERRTLITDKTIGMKPTVDETLEELDEILDMGFTEVKMKVGRSGLRDLEHVAAVRERGGPDLPIRVDSNQGWDYPTAVANLNAMQTLGVQYSEQPLAHWDHENLKRLRRKVTIPLCADESVFDDRDAFKLLSEGAVDYLNIKLGKSGGINTALRIEAIARSAGSKCMLGCFAESRLGLTAAAHLACARPNIHFLDLDSAFILKQDPVEGGIQYDAQIASKIELPDEPGIGARISERFLESAEHVRLS
ncbi:MAG: dipeptide epimerase [Xanthomonadales bacterium]|nr:dipeptide epimerase [Xanthomonadales bacterium]